MKNHLSSSDQSKSIMTEVKHDVCYGYTSMKEEYSRLKMCGNKVMVKICGQRVRKYEEAAEDCLKKSYMICMFFNILLSWSNKGE